ncbi:MAG: UDP-N-acetylmuramoyl-L-alanyl-D-glutamate--2,6-diaminopimelate ligase [Clostridiales bacterium]|jgi:UDP-N-acetylmuramyl-tripeptide synthetase|nr:UDP-N-acetylmuramoyl-L-alanyl-D-glutamate--2,6-diaminopimelate ligase [Clostridiales bacterium]
MLLKEILKGINITWIQGKNIEVEDIVIDSRKVQYGSLFICLNGLRADGHRFIKDAASAGAAAIIVRDDQIGYPENVTVVKTDDTRKALAITAANFYYRPSEAFNLIGVTGTKGKTTTTYMLEAVLQQFNHKTGVIGTLGAKIGGQKLDIHYDTSTTPDPVELQRIFSAMKDKKVNDVVMEVSSQALALEKLEGLQFNTAIFTNLTQDHLDFHKTMDNYMLAKSKLFKQARHGVVNVDSEEGWYILKHGTCDDFVTFSIDRKSDLKAEHIKYLENGVEFTVDIYSRPEEFFVPIKGRFTVYNALGVIGAALTMKIPAESIKKSLSAMKGVPGRIQDIPNDIGVHVIVDYAHSPDSIVNIINAVREFTKGRVIILFGCGGNRDAVKRPIMGKISGELADYCIITSDNPRGEDPLKIIEAVESGVKETTCPYIVEADRRAAIFKGINMLAPEDALIVAGKGHENYQIIGGDTIHFDDVEVAKEALEALR